MGLTKINESSGVVPDSFLDQFEPFVCGDVAVVLSNIEMFGEEFPKDPINIPYDLKDYAEKQKWIAEKIIHDNEIVVCDSIIVIPKKVWRNYPDYPAYVSWCIGHELGHAKNAKEDTKTYIFACLIYQFFVDRGIAKKYEVPNEKLCDQFGVYVASHLFSSKIFKAQVQEIVLRRNGKDIERLNNVLLYKGTNDFKRLKKMLVDFALPFKDELTSLWEDETNYSNSLVNYLIEHYHVNESLDSLFDI